MTPTMPKQPPLPHVLQLRLDDRLRKYVVFLAARDDVTMAEAVRQVLRRSLASQRIPVVADESEVGTPAAGHGPLALVIDGMSEATVAELAAELKDE